MVACREALSSHAKGRLAPSAANLNFKLWLEWVKLDTRSDVVEPHFYEMCNEFREAENR